MGLTVTFLLLYGTYSEAFTLHCRV